MTPAQRDYTRNRLNRWLKSVDFPKMTRREFDFFLENAFGGEIPDAKAHELADQLIEEMQNTMRELKLKQLASLLGETDD